MTRKPLLVLAALSGAGALALALTLPTSSVSAAAPAAAQRGCPAGTTHVNDTTLEAFAAGQVGSCQAAKGVESFRELSQANASIEMRQRSGAVGQVSSQAFAAGVAQAAALQATGIASPTSAWKQYQKTPLINDVAGYDRVNGLGLADISGRIEDFAYDPSSSGHWFAAIANGGVYETKTAGASWKSIGDNLPIQVTGALAYSKANGGTLLVGTGDPAFGGSSNAGLGAYWTKDGGKHWTKSVGVPDGTISFKAVTDPTNNKRMYLATGKGLYRSDDVGKTFKNVVLPTTCTDTNKPTCFFANIVTDVVVRPNDPNGTGGGKVLAVVGWRAGTKLNAQGKPQSPRNGLYSSPTGAPGSFTFNGAAAGFADQVRVGRTTLAVAEGANQDHDYVFAVVQDADKFNNFRTATGGVPEPGELSGTVPGNTVLNGIYASPDFGKNWTKIADSQQLAAPGSGTALVGVNTVSYAPGVQSWYNSWIEVDPTAGNDVSGAPARIAFGLEEVWTNITPLVISPVGVPQPPVDPPSGTTQFQVIGRYFGGTSCLGLNTTALIPGGAPYCPANGVDTVNGPTTTTHPDQHAGMFVPKGEGVTLVVGNDGGAYAQSVGRGQRFSNSNWKRGANVGFDDLLPYDAAMAKDGTVWIGLQDNGTAKIEPNGRVVATYGGDGFYVAVDPDDSKVAWEEYTNGDIRVTRDGGKSWTDNAPSDLTGALFATPFKMDPTDSDHLVIGGRIVYETTRGAGTASDSWKNVFDLGTRTHPGSSSAAAGDGDPVNSLSAVDVRGDSIYVGYCGYCDIVTGGVPFNSGIATNVGGTWHIAKAKGLPKRYITSVTIDEKNPKVVYATLGGYGRRWIPPGSLGDDVSKIGVGHVFRSTDGGATFKDVSGDLPDLPANHVLPYKGKLIVSTDVGVYVSKTTSGGSYHQLGRGLPAVPTFEVSVAPQNKNLLVAATYGRTVWTALAGDLDRVVDVTAPVVQPPKKPASGGGLAATGGAPAVAVVALLLLVAAAATRRRHRAL